MRRFRSLRRCVGRVVCGDGSKLSLFFTLFAKSQDLFAFVLRQVCPFVGIVVTSMNAVLLLLALFLIAPFSLSFAWGGTGSGDLARVVLRFGLCGTVHSQKVLLARFEVLQLLLVTVDDGLGLDERRIGDPIHEIGHLFRFRDRFAKLFQGVVRMLVTVDVIMEAVLPSSCKLSICDLRISLFLAQDARGLSSGLPLDS